MLPSNSSRFIRFVNVDNMEITMIDAAMIKISIAFF